MTEYQSNSKGKNFGDWHWFIDKMPRDLQNVLIRTSNNEMFVMTHRKSDKGESYFNLSTYSPNFKLGDWYLEDLLQWHPIPGFE